MRRRLWLLLALALLLPVACRRSEPMPTIARAGTPLPDSGVALAIPAAWRAAYNIALDSAGLRDVTETEEAAAAAGLVRAGRVALAVTDAGNASGLTQAAVEQQPVALVVPLTFAVEGLTSAQARDLVAGRITDWQAVGGPRLRVSAGRDPSDATPDTILHAVGVAPAQPQTEQAGTAGRLWLQAGSVAPVGRKALRIDGALPDESGYPFVERRVLVGRSGQGRLVDERGTVLRDRLTAERERDITLDAVGDIMLGRSVGEAIRDRGPAFPLALVQPVLARADVRFGNVEIALTERGMAANKDYVFRAPPETSTRALLAGGFNLVSIANNHAFDYGPEGLADTIAALDRAGIAYAGAGQDVGAATAPRVITVKGVRIALLAFVNVPDDSISGFHAESMAAGVGRPGVAWATPGTVRDAVTKARPLADLVIVSLHTGFEYTAGPNTLQRELARAAIDAGAGLVLGGHPHVLQGFETYKGVPLIYSLGNFVFDLDNDDRRQTGLPSVLTVIMRTTIRGGKVVGVRFIPCQIDQRDARPVPVQGAEAAPVLERLYRLTDALSSN